MRPGYEPFKDDKGRLRCGGKCKRWKDNDLVRWLISQGTDPEIAHLKCQAFPIKPKDRCKKHAGRPLIHGLKSRYRDTYLGEKIDAARNDPRLGDLSEQLAIVSAGMLQALEEIDKAVPCEECGQWPQRGLAAAESISRIGERFARIRKIQQEITHGITVKVLTEARGELVTLFAQAMKDEGIDADIIRRVAKRIVSGGSN